MYKKDLERRYYKKALKRRYYVEYCPYGVNIAHQSFGGNAFHYYAFNSKRERESWLNRHDSDQSSGVVAAPITRRDMEGRIGKFRVITANSHLGNEKPIFTDILYDVVSEKQAARMGLAYWEHE